MNIGEGVPGAGDGSTRVGEDGGLVDAAGNPVMGADSSGGEIIGPTAPPVTDNEGNPLTNATS